MTDRERLLDILSKPIFPHEPVDPLEAVADYLLDNGVTFAKDTDVSGKWISVDDRLPETEGTYLVCTDKGAVYTGHFYNEREFPGGYRRPNSWTQRGSAKVAYWMKLPEPPGEGE